jgi:hypothetical protein
VLDVTIDENPDNGIKTISDIKSNFRDINVFSWTPEENDIGGIYNLTIGTETLIVEVLPALPDIPVLGLLHQYDWSDGSTTTSTVPDLASDDDLTGGFTNLNATINGVQAGNFDGCADSVSGAFSSSVAQPVEIFSVTETSNNGDIQNITTGTNNNNITAKRYKPNDFNYQLHAGDNLKGGSPASNEPELLTTRFDGGSSLLRVNGSEEFSGHPGTNGMDGLVVSRDDQPVDGAVAEVLVYDPTVSDYSRSDVEQYLADKWGITLA